MLYPPILTSTQPVFDIDQFNSNGLIINFTLASITSSNDFNGIDVLIAQQSNNASVIQNTSTGWLSLSSSNYVLDGTKGYVTINNNSVSLVAGCLYKVQLRLTYTSRSTSVVTRSEWSTVMIIKLIHKPELSVIAADVLLEEGTTTVPSVTPLFKGNCAILAEDKEVEEKYKFTLYQGDTLITSSDWLSHKVGEVDSWYCNTVLDNQQSYTVIYEIITNNNYNIMSTFYNFIALSAVSGDLEVVFQAIPNKPLARIDLYISQTSDQTLANLTGDFVISRTSEKTNFQIFEDIQFIVYDEQSITNPYLSFSDYTIESGIKYQYAIQKFNATRSRTNLQKTEKIELNYEYAYLYRDGIQLQLSLNQNISSFKHTVLRNKQDTLGSKYPYLSQNGNAYYAEFSLSGLISYQENIGTFFTLKDGAYYRDKLVISSDKFESFNGSRKALDDSNLGFNVETFNHKESYNFGDAITQDLYANNDDLIATRRKAINNSNSNNTVTASQSNFSTASLATDYSISTNLTDNNIYIERIFREKVEEFLNEFNCKLFKSATEGNLVIILMNVALRPIDSLGRMLYEFSATAYEMADNDLSSLNEYGVINIGNEQEQQKEQIQTRLSFGQVRISPENQINNITELIQDQEKIPIDELTNWVLQDIKQIWIEAYPTENYPIQSNYFKLNINNATIVVPTNKIYTFKAPSNFDLEELDTEESSYNGLNISIPNQNNNYPPFLINYICKTKRQYNTNASSVSQISTVFDFDQVIWNNETNDLIAFIQEKIAQKNGWTKNTHGDWEDNDCTYSFDHIRSLDILTQTGALITIGSSQEVSEIFKVGYTYNADRGEFIKNTFNSSRIIFPSLDEDGDAHAKYLTIDNALSAIINFSFYYTKLRIIEEAT